MASANPRGPGGSERPSLSDVHEWIGWEVGDVHGAVLGRLEDVLMSDDGAWAEWLVVNEFRFGDGHRFVIPAEHATAANGRVWVPFERSLISASSQLASTRHTPEAELRLRAHYLIGDAA